jgi:hypothetical protein
MSAAATGGSLPRLRAGMIWRVGCARGSFLNSGSRAGLLAVERGALPGQLVHAARAALVSRMGLLMGRTSVSPPCAFDCLIPVFAASVHAGDASGDRHLNCGHQASMVVHMRQLPGGYR